MKSNKIKMQDLHTGQAVERGEHDGADIAVVEVDVAHAPTDDDARVVSRSWIVLPSREMVVASVGFIGMCPSGRDSSTTTNKILDTIEIAKLYPE